MLCFYMILAPKDRLSKVLRNTKLLYFGVFFGALAGRKTFNRSMTSLITQGRNTLFTLLGFCTTRAGWWFHRWVVWFCCVYRFRTTRKENAETTLKPALQRLATRFTASWLRSGQLFCVKAGSAKKVLLPTSGSFATTTPSPSSEKNIKQPSQSIQTLKPHGREFMGRI